MKGSDNFKSGFAAVIGRPNVGKSTLVNSLIGQKIAIMSDKPQTTRNKIMCILNLPDAQILFIDTPGIHKPRHKLGEYMVKTAENTLREVDVVLFVVDATEEPGAGEQYILERLAAVNTPVVLVINKIDKITKPEVLPVIERYAGKYDFTAIVPISALAHTNLQNLVDEIKKHLEPGPKYYPDDMVTDQPERLIIASTKKNIPH